MTLYRDMSYSSPDLFHRFIARLSDWRRRRRAARQQARNDRILAKMPDWQLDDIGARRPSSPAERKGRRGFW